MHLHTLAYRVYRVVRSVLKFLGIFGLIRRFLGPAAGRLIFGASPGSSKPVEVNGFHMRLAPPGTYPPLSMAMGNYEAETVALLQNLIGPNSVVIDIGAHVGYYSLLAARQVKPNGRVYAFEPEPGNYALLCQNIELNGFTNVFPLNKAISCSVGSATLYLSALDNGRHSLYQDSVPLRGEALVETTTLDSFLQGEGWPEIDLIKIDVEGAEMDVFGGMAGLIQRSPRLNMIVEFNPVLLQAAGLEPINFLEKPVTWGFTIQYIDPKSGLTPLATADVPQLVSRVTADDSSVNLLCSKK